VNTLDGILERLRWLHDELGRLEQIAGYVAGSKVNRAGELQNTQPAGAAQQLRWRIVAARAEVGEIGVALKLADNGIVLEGDHE
jgi:hypothetical protein